MAYYAFNEMKLAFFMCAAVCASAQDGATLFASLCAGCHGADGAGGEHAPTILKSTRDLSETIRRGIPDRGMPAFTLTELERTALVRYVRALSAPVGHTESAVTVRLADGTALTGTLRNESNYDSQVLGADGRLHVVSKSRDLRGPVSPEGDWPTYHGQITGNRHSDLQQIQVSNVGASCPPGCFRSPSETPGRNTHRGRWRSCTSPPPTNATRWTRRTDGRSGTTQRPLTKGVIGDAASAINRGVAVLHDKVFMVTDHAHIIALNRLTGASYLGHGNGRLSRPLRSDRRSPGGGQSGSFRNLRRRRRARPDSLPPISGNRRRGVAILHHRGAREPGSAAPSSMAASTPGSPAPTIPPPILIFWPTGNPCPDYNGDERKGDNLYANSVVALEPKTGKLRWYYQFTPHDVHDWDAVAPRR